MNLRINNCRSVSANAKLLCDHGHDIVAAFSTCRTRPGWKYERSRCIEVFAWCEADFNFYAVQALARFIPPMFSPKMQVFMHFRQRSCFFWFGGSLRPFKNGLWQGRDFNVRSQTICWQCKIVSISMDWRSCWFWFRWRNCHLPKILVNARYQIAHAAYLKVGHVFFPLHKHIVFPSITNQVSDRRKRLETHRDLVRSCGDDLIWIYCLFLVKFCFPWIQDLKPHDEGQCLEEMEVHGRGQYCLFVWICWNCPTGWIW